MVLCMWSPKATLHGRSSEGESERVGGWMNSLTLRLLTPLFQKTTPTHPVSNTRRGWCWVGGGGGDEREIGRASCGERVEWGEGWKRERKREEESERREWEREREREREKERERFHAYSSTLSRQRPPARQLFLASPHAIFRPLPLFEAFIRKRSHQMKASDGGGCFGGLCFILTS